MIVEEALKPTTAAPDCQWALAGVPVGESSGYQLPPGPFLKFYPHDAMLAVMNSIR